MIVTLRVAAWLRVALICAATLAPSEALPVTGLPVNAERFLAFLVAGGCFGLAYAHRPLRSILLIVGFAALFELAQHLVPGRHGVFRDFLFKGAGGILGVAAGAFCARALSLVRRD
jgi:VanZ family protein